MDQSQLNKELILYWRTIWHIVARKHWYDFGVPINVVTYENWPPMKNAAPLRGGGVTITVCLPNIQINIALERQDIFWRPSRFPEIVDQVVVSNSWISRFKARIASTNPLGSVNAPTMHSAGGSTDKKRRTPSNNFLIH